MNIYSLVLTLCLMAIPTSSIPTILSLVKDLNPSRQRFVLFRETFFSMVLAFIFLYIGKPFLQIAEIETYALNISGGSLLFLIALRMIFPSRREASQNSGETGEPFFFPIATPLLSGGGVLTVVIVCAQQASLLKVTLAICIVWSIVLAVMLSLPFLYKILKKRGLIVVENLMGMILLMRACDLIQNGISIFLHRLHP